MSILVTKENNNNLMHLNKIIQEEINTYKFQNNYYLNENFLIFYNDNFINYIKNLKNTLFHSICDSIDAASLSVLLLIKIFSISQPNFSLQNISA